MTDNLAARLQKACSTLGLRIDIGFNLSLGNVKIHTVARLPELGAPNGMLIVKSFDHVEKFSDALTKSGYGFSVLSEPSPESIFDIDSFQDMFTDWGWSGEPARKPEWMDV